MRVQAAGLAERSPQRARLLHPAGVSRRGEVTAALAAAALRARPILARAVAAVRISRQAGTVRLAGQP
jgi:hypothetical protein